MPRRHFRTIRISHCERDDCPNPSGESGECREHEAERFERNARYLAHVVDAAAAGPACRVCHEPLADLDWTTCECCRHPIPDSTEEP